MADVWSARTKEHVASAVIREVDDLYPDRCATPDDPTATPMTHEYSIRSTTATHARLQISSTTEDMSRLFKWEYGDEIYGSFAKDSPSMNEYINDINVAYGREDDYKPFFVDTLSEKMTVGEQLAEK